MMTILTIIAIAILTLGSYKYMKNRKEGERDVVLNQVITVVALTFVIVQPLSFILITLALMAIVGQAAYRGLI